MNEVYGAGLRISHDESITYSVKCGTDVKNMFDFISPICDASVTNYVMVQCIES